MSKKRKQKKEFNDKNYTQFGRMGWCLSRKMVCIGNCTECTLHEFPDLSRRFLSEENIAVENKEEEHA